jgi:hypothetical protein
MIITKLIEVGINIQNCINIYTEDSIILQILIDKYQGKCFASCYIKEIVRVVKIGECIINQDGLPTFGVIPVIFEVIAIVYTIGETINGCVVSHRDQNGVLVCDTDITSIIVARHPAFESVTKGQIISVRVVGSKYSLSARKIAVSAIPYLFADQAIIYKFNYSTDIHLDFFKDVLNRIEYEEAEMAKFKETQLKAWTTFDQLLYAYKDIQKPPTDVTVINIKDLINGEGKFHYLSRDNRLNLSTPQVYNYADAIFPPNARLLDNLPSSNIILILLEDYCAHLKMIREMIGIYSTGDKLLAHTNLWQIFKKNKL